MNHSHEKKQTLMLTFLSKLGVIHYMLLNYCLISKLYTFCVSLYMCACILFFKPLPLWVIVSPYERYNRISFNCMNIPKHTQFGNSLCSSIKQCSPFFKWNWLFTFSPFPTITGRAGRATTSLKSSLWLASKQPQGLCFLGLSSLDPSLSL